MSCRSIFLILLFLLPGTARAQTPVEGMWDGARALELVARAQERRMEAHADTGLVNYQADARIYVYFYLDREDTQARNLVKTDQVALELFWEAPDLVKQRIVGWRDEKSLPTNIHYHLDHLTVVMENFGNEIRLGDGDEVQGVPHPAAPAAEAFYEYRLADSLTLRLPGAAEPVRVYEIEVRPRNLRQPGFVGSVFVDRRAGDIVRMDFTFTPTAYRDPYLDYINISLDNGLWKGRFWLPNQQQVEIRRRLPVLDIPAGSVIRATIEVSDYQFNLQLPPRTFSGPPVVTVSEEQRETFDFEEPLHAELREEGIGPAAELGEIRRQAQALAEEQVLSGVRGSGISIDSASHALRYNRAEGAVLGLGLATPVARGVQASVYGGWAFGADHAIGEVALERRAERSSVGVSILARLPRQVGDSGASGVGATLSSLFAASDPLDLFYATGVELIGTLPLSDAWSARATIRGEKHESAALTSDYSFSGDGFRPVHRIDATDLMLSARGVLARAAPEGLSSWWTGSISMEAGTGEVLLEAERLEYLKSMVALAWGRRFEVMDAQLDAAGRLGGAVGEIPRQALFLVGGRGTLPGYPLHAFGGDREATARLVVSAAVAGPWVRGRLVGAAGWTGVGGAGEAALARWGASTTDGLKASAGVGVGLFRDLLHVDFIRGLSEGGDWEVIVDANRGFWDFL